jgi:hypothetical protein
MMDRLRQLLDSELELIREENPELLTLEEQLKLAKSRMNDYVGMLISRIARQRLESHIESVNKTHFG